MIEHDFNDELIQDYLAESQEHLATIENDLLAIEQAGAQIDEQLVNRVFRAAHSIKGGAGFFGLTVIRELAHKTENVLDLIRSRQITPNSETVSILLLSFDKLRELVNNYANSNQVEITEFVTALTAVAGSHLPQSQRDLLSATVALKTPAAKRLIEVSAFDLDQARRGGKWIYLIRYDLFHDFDRRGKTPLSALRTLIKCGTILETAIDLQSAGSLEDEPSHQFLMEVLYATVLEKDLIGDLVEVKPDQIQVIERNGSTASLKQPEDAAAPAPPPPPQTAAAQTVPGPGVEATIRLNVGLLDSLMTLAGELVLSRNELNEALSTRDHQGIETAAHRLSLVTSELQEAVALTRMQPVGTVFAKFPRVVRELARALGKEVDLQMDGGDVEVDKTILEGLSDPLTHMVRNSVDHGIETPEQRRAAGKPATGTVTLSARHQAGQVVIEIADDGRGLAADKVMASCVKKGLISQEQASVMTEGEKMALIFLPGSSTAEKVSDVSGRGVGMDVVKTNLDKLGGKIEIDSSAGRGTSFRIKLPLTLAIMPSLLVSEGGERFAIPQTSVGELIRIPPAQRAERINHAGGAEVLLLRDRLVPLLHLSDALEIPNRRRAEGAWNVVLVGSGTFEYGLVVEELHDTVEIVVKPLGRHLQAIRDYAGATILGDGKVAPIIDIELLASRAGLTQTTMSKESAATTVVDRSSLLLFFNAPTEPCALPIELVTRIESVEPHHIEYLGGRRTFQYRGASLPLVSLHDVAAVGQLEETQDWKVIIVERNGGSFGLLAAGPLDMVETALSMDSMTLRQTGVAGSAILNGKATLILEIVELAESALGRQEAPAKAAIDPKPDAGTQPKPPTILVAEDSEFFRKQITKLIEAVGYRVLPAEDGQAAWESLNTNGTDVSVVVTDLEMPRLDGLALTRQIRADQRFAGLPIIALSALAGEEEIERGLAMGVTEYQVKLDQDQLLDGIHRAIQGRLR